MQMIDMLLDSIKKNQSIIAKQEMRQDKLFNIQVPPIEKSDKTPFFIAVNNILLRPSITTSKIEVEKGSPNYNSQDLSRKLVGVCLSKLKTAQRR